MNRRQVSTNFVILNGDGINGLALIFKSPKDIKKNEVYDVVLNVNEIKRVIEKEKL